MEEGSRKSTIAEHIAKFRGTVPCPKEERTPEKQADFWWMSPGAARTAASMQHGTAPAAASSPSNAPGQLTRAVSDGSALAGEAASIQFKKGRFTIRKEPSSPGHVSGEQRSGHPSPSSSAGPGIWSPASRGGG
ncbi:hypothetical protein OEZ85_009572 [Tetradesmus obliquus]|uniref:Uncharacterized protein n=1 Tax=Tetradesmus obliquus TaxID=3088 RepID=A0ABY8UEJ9_TETOB|nr:hypothetical protein OEZ85_009572 [Tetradesmus obliquus]